MPLSLPFFFLLFFFQLNLNFRNWDYFFPLGDLGPRACIIVSYIRIPYIHKFVFVCTR
jgi:hypothetical protein